MATPEPAGAFRCSVAAETRQEPMFATASRVRRWLLVEQPGPWGPQSVPMSRLALPVRRALRRLANELDARLLLIRRPHRVAREGAPSSERRIFFADSRLGRERLVTRTFTDEAELAELRPVMRGAPWQRVDEPLYLVCTHGRHDPCCALQGRPVADALALRQPELTWESSHLGGDRFAGNVVVLPTGLYLGRVRPADVDTMLSRLAVGRLPIAQLRGRSSLSLPAQAAQHFVRTHLAGQAQATDLLEPDVPLDHISDLRPRAQELVGELTWRLELEAPDGAFAVTVRRVQGEEHHKLTCHAMELRPYPSFVLVDLQPQPA